MFTYKTYSSIVKSSFYTDLKQLTKTHFRLGPRSQLQVSTTQSFPYRPQMTPMWATRGQQHQYHNNNKSVKQGHRTLIRTTLITTTTDLLPNNKKDLTTALWHPELTPRPNNHREHLTRLTWQAMQTDKTLQTNI